MRHDSITVVIRARCRRIRLVRRDRPRVAQPGCPAAFHGAGRSLALAAHERRGASLHRDRVGADDRVGFYLGARVGVLGDGWMRATYAALLVMAIVSGPVARAPMRALRQAAQTPGDEVVSALREAASHSILRLSLRVRVAFGLAVVYLMIGKPDAPVIARPGNCARPDDCDQHFKTATAVHTGGRVPMNNGLTTRIMPRRNRTFNPLAATS